MNKIRAAMLAATLAISGFLQASAHGHGGGGGMHMSSAHFSSFHSSPSFHSFSSFHSSPSFHSFSSYHSSPSFHSAPSFPSHSYSSPSSGFGGFENSGSSGSFGGSGFGHHHNSENINSQPGISNDTGESHHGGFLFWGHHHNELTTAFPKTGVPGTGVGVHPGGGLGVGPGSGIGVNPGAGIGVVPGTGLGAMSGNPHHHGGFLFWGHHNNNYNPQNYGDGSPNAVAYGHHHGYNPYYNSPYNNSMNMYPISTMPPPSTFVINMASPPITQPLPIHSLSITKYFYSSPPPINYNYGYFGGYGSTYGGYGYLPTRGIASLLFRLLSLIGYGGRSSYYSSGLNSNNFLGTWGPQSSLMSGAFDDGNNTNFVDNYNNFNYTGGNVQPFANLLPDGVPYGDNDPQNLALQQANPQYQNGMDPNAQNYSAQNLNMQNQDQQNPDQQNFNQNGNQQNPDAQNQDLLSMNPPNQYLPPGLQGQVSDNTTADNQVELRATALAMPPVVAFPNPKYDYHHIGVLGSAFTHDIKLPKGSYKAPELLGLIFTHQFWDSQEQTPADDQDQQQQAILTGNN